jgi:spore germination cell wall hydrolase CwlJ-like protein
MFATSALGATSEQIIAATLLGEARGEGLEGIYAVGTVIAQRSIDRKITPAAVCLQKKQFSCNNKGIQLNLLDSSKEAKYALLLAQNILKLDKSFVKNANFYHEKTVRPKWSLGRSPVVIIKNHLFYKI